jgi:hypothetical protein
MVGGVAVLPGHRLVVLELAEVPLFEAIGQPTGRLDDGHFGGLAGRVSFQADPSNVEPFPLLPLGRLSHRQVNLSELLVVFGGSALIVAPERNRPNQEIRHHNREHQVAYPELHPAELHGRYLLTPWDGVKLASTFMRNTASTQLSVGLTSKGYEQP